MTAMISPIPLGCFGPDFPRFGDVKLSIFGSEKFLRPDFTSSLSLKWHRSEAREEEGLHPLLLGVECRWSRAHPPPPPHPTFPEIEKGKIPVASDRKRRWGRRRRRRRVHRRKFRGGRGGGRKRRRRRVILVWSIEAPMAFTGFSEEIWRSRP